MLDLPIAQRGGPQLRLLKETSTDPAEHDGHSSALMFKSSAMSMSIID
jgi:hypothetical protein